MFVNYRKIEKIVEDRGHFDGVGQFAPIIRLRIRSFVAQYRNTLPYKSDTEIGDMFDDHSEALSCSESNSPAGW